MGIKDRTGQRYGKLTAIELTFRGETMTIAEWSRKVGLGGGTLAQRLRLGWSVEEALTTPARTKSRRWEKRA